MGYPMAANLLKAGYSVRVWDRTSARAAQGATSVSRPEEVAEAGALVISSLSNDRVLAAR
jgi:3-hydroxyisobutyrate dehydrogenase-like beta-hydroxyacid dehydrogenase